MKAFSFLALLSITFSCSQTQENFSTICVLPNQLKEASACEISNVSPLIWTIEDNHNDNILFGFNEKGELQKKIRITNVENNDWEDLTSDDEGNIYIGDFGNNDNYRENLAIYKIKAEDLNKDETEAESVVQFYYPEQTEFPPKKKDRIFDVESFFIHNNKFYLFTKKHEIPSFCIIKYIYAYIVLITYVLRKMGETKTSCKHFITEFIDCTDSLRKQISPNICNQILGTQQRAHLRQLQNFISQS